MSSIDQKVPLFQSLNYHTDRKVGSAFQTSGRAYPCSVVSVVSSGIVTVKFEIDAGALTLPQVTIPLFGPEYIRYPIQVEDKGFAIPADASLRAMSGLGTGIADLSEPGNLTALVFLPIGSTKWSTVDPNAVTIYGPNGVVLRDTGSYSTIVLTPNGVVITGQNTVSLVCGSSSVTVTPSGVSIVGTLTINGQAYLAHEHSGVQAGGSNTGGVV